MFGGNCVSKVKENTDPGQSDTLFWQKRNIRSRLTKQLLAEFIGTFILVFIIACSGVHSNNYNSGFVSVMVANSYAVFAGVLISAPISDGHINPAITVAQVVTHGFRVRKAIFYIMAQFAGAIVATLCSYCVYRDVIMATSAKLPAIYYTTFPSKYMTVGGALLSEVFGTFMLITSFYIVTDQRRTAITNRSLCGASVMALTLPGIISSMGAQTMASLNPARDLGPRLVAAFLHPNTTVWSFPSSSVHCAGKPYWWIPVVGSLIGGVLAGVVYCMLVGAHWSSQHERSEDLGADGSTKKTIPNEQSRCSVSTVSTEIAQSAMVVTKKGETPVPDEHVIIDGIARG